MKRNEILDYVSLNKPAAHIDGRTALTHGVELGRQIVCRRSRFLEESGCRSYLDYKKKKMKDGRILWNILLGLATLNDQIEGSKRLYQSTHKLGMEFDSLQPIPSGLITMIIVVWTICMIILSFGNTALLLLRELFIPVYLWEKRNILRRKHWKAYIICFAPALLSWVVILWVPRRCRIKQMNIMN